MTRLLRRSSAMSGGTAFFSLVQIFRPRMRKCSGSPILSVPKKIYMLFFFYQLPPVFFYRLIWPRRYQHFTTTVFFATLLISKFCSFACVACKRRDKFYLATKLVTRLVFSRPIFFLATGVFPFPLTNWFYFVCHPCIALIQF